MAASVLKTSVKAKSPDFEKNHRRIIDLLTKIKNEEEQIRQGGGAKAIESQHKKGRLTARERIAKLIDPGSQFFELSIFAAYEMYTEWGGAPSAGTITGLAKVCGRTFMLIANDATVKAGAFFPMTAKKSFAHKTSRSKITSPRFILSTPRAFFCRSRKMSSQTPTISVAFFATTP